MDSPTTPDTVPAPQGLWPFLRNNPLNWLLLFVPICLAAELLHAPALVIFLASALAIVPLAGLIGEATEELAGRTSPAVGGLLNATFGNAPELIIAIMALQHGLITVVTASISGSIIGNILLVLGASMLAGGWGKTKQRFDRTNAGASASMLLLAVIALVMPAVFDLTVHQSLGTYPDVIRISLYVAIVLIVIYLASLVFTLKTHSRLITTHGEARLAQLSLRDAYLVLAAATLLTGMASEFLVTTISVATHALGMSEFFIGAIVVAIVGNAAEHFSAVVMARKGKMDLAVTICTASSTQVALFVAPVLIFVSYLFGHPMSLVFSAFEITGIALSVVALAFVSLDGESNWFEGLQLIAVYAIIAIVFFFAPAPR
jgi:Ca2+:H+ antiporter